MTRILVTRPRYGRMKVDKRGGRALTSPNRVTASGRGLKRRLNGT